MTRTKPGPIALWLFICCGMIVVMALLGAVTRLTESGLSITNWAPVTGALPPLSHADWQKAFEGYQQIPQYKLLHRGMTLHEFKTIYFWEWLHRLWGRIIGIVFLLPLIWFAARREIDKKLALQFGGIFLLGCLQGFIGWFMVQSGLATRTYVSPYRLALHLGFALLIYAILFWMALDQARARRVPASWCLRRHGWVSLALLAITMVWGAFTAGLHAGQAYNTWPLMEGDVVPAAAFTIIPKYLNAFQNLALVQFIHRWLGPLTALVILGWSWRLIRFDDLPARRWPIALGLMAMLQVMLGIGTLLSHAEVAVATIHQAGAITLLSLLLVNIHALRRLTNQTSGS